MNSLNVVNDAAERAVKMSSDSLHTAKKEDPIEKKYVYIIGRVYENFIRNIGYSVLKLIHQRND